MEEFKKASCIRGFYAYQDNWTPILGERLVCKNEPDIPRDRYAVAVYKAGDEIVGNLPRNIPTMCSDRTRAWSAFCHDKNSLENFRDWRLIRENRESFPPRTICIIRYDVLPHKHDII